MEHTPESSLVAPKTEGGEGFSSVHLLVMGLSGAGKSTFISKATGDTSIARGSGIMGVTQVVQEHILYHQGTEVHLIDTPGFDDSKLTSHEVLDKIALWINTVYSQGWRVGGIIYLYDISRIRLGAIGSENIRVLEEMTGKDRWKHISLVTTRWTGNGSEEEIEREQQLGSEAVAWKALREGSRPARMCRFHNTKESAFEIIQWHLDQSFEPELSRQMAKPGGQRLALGSTNAGRILLNSYTPALMRQGRSDDLDRLNDIMGKRFDDSQFRFALQGNLEMLRRARREKRLRQVGRWAFRMTMAGGTILVTLATENPQALSAGWAAGRVVDDRLKRSQTMKEEEVAAIEEAIASAVWAKNS